jgi:hypothetical protein
MRAEGLLTILLAVAIFVLARSVRRERRWAIRCTTVVELLSVLGSLLLALLPIGATRGPVPLLTNIVLPAAIIALSTVPSPLWGRTRMGGQEGHPNQVGLGAETAA